MTAITSAVLFRSESKGSGFQANERTPLSLLLISREDRRL